MNEITFKDFGEKGNWIGGCDAASASSQNLDVTTPYWGKKYYTVQFSCYGPTMDDPHRHYSGQLLYPQTVRTDTSFSHEDG